MYIYCTLLYLNGEPIEVKITNAKDSNLNLKGYSGLYVDGELHLLNNIDVGDLVEFLTQNSNYEDFIQYVNNNTWTKL